jgi:CheY-like chemotaxis protein
MGYRILIADDNRIVCNLIRDILVEERADIQTVTVSSAQDALVEAGNERWDLIITESQMPDMDGLTLIEAIQSLIPGIPAILTTTTDLDEINERKRKRSAFFTAFVKPFSIASFINHIDDLLPKRRPTPIASKASRRPQNRGPVGRPGLKPVMG